MENKYKIKIDYYVNSSYDIIGSIGFEFAMFKSGTALKIKLYKFVLLISKKRKQNNTLACDPN